MKRYLFLGVLLVVFFASCAPRVPFTQAIREKYKLQEDELRQIQFYNSSDIVLQRGERDSSQKETTDGELVLKSGKSVEEVVIPRGTPGVVERVVDANTFTVSFETGEKTDLVFADKQNRKGPYYLQTAPWRNNKRQLQYQGKMYSTSSASNNIYLEFKMKHLRSFKKEQRVVKGRKIN